MSCCMHLDIDDPPSSFHLYSFLDIFLHVLESSLRISIIPRHHVLILQSHGKSKRSFHVVIRIVIDDIEFMWRNNRQCGDFVKFFLQKVYSHVYLNEPQDEFQDFSREHLKVIVDESRKSCLDSAIYTRNRCFRLFLSSKFGSNRTLQLKVPHTYCVSSTASVLRHSFVTLPLKFCTKLIEHNFKDSSPRPDVSNVKYFVCSNNSCFDTKLFSQFNYYCTNGVINRIIKIQSPYLILRTTDHYCPYARRCHRNNFIYFLINLETKCLFIRCYDSDCPQVNSQYYKIDTALIEQLKDINFGL